jgi:hypothetical protein
MPQQEVVMQITLAALASIVGIALAVPATAQGFAGCPPGLAAKGCVPPGQAKKMGGYAAPPVVVYPPPATYAPAYPDYYRPSVPTLNLTLPLQ